MKTPPYQILVVEDNALVASNIAASLEEYGYIVTAKALSAHEALKSLEEVIPDLIVMDIELGEGSMDGIELASSIHKEWAIPIIYLTDKTDERTVERAGNIHREHYLPKPFSAPVLRANIEKVREDSLRKSQSERDFLFVKERSNDSKRVKVFFRDICYIEPDRAYCCLYVLEKPSENKLRPIVLSESMNSFCKRLPGDFIRISRYVTVNIHHIDSWHPGEVEVQGKAFTIGNTYKEQFLRKIE